MAHARELGRVPGWPQRAGPSLRAPRPGPGNGLSDPGRRAETGCSRPALPRDAGRCDAGSLLPHGDHVHVRTASPCHLPCPFSLSSGVPVTLEGAPLRGERPSSTLVSPLKALFPVWPPSACERGLGEGARATSGNMTCARNGGGGPPSSESADLCPVVGATALRRRQLLKRLFLLRPNSSRLYPPPHGPRAALPFDSGVSGRF